MNVPKVTIVMLTYNRPQMIGRAIASATAQTLADWELVIVQDGDNPETEVLVQQWSATDARIRFFRRGLVGSIAEASNFALEQARGEYVAILDDDDWWASPGKLASQVAFLDQRPDYVATGGGYIVVDQHGKQRGHFYKPESDQAIRAKALIANPIANSTAMFRRVVNGNPVRYDASLRQFADWDFWLAMGSLGKLHNVPEDLAYYALWDGGSSFKHQKANAWAGLRIIGKHRRAYRGYVWALPMSLLYLAYAHLPMGLKRISYESLSALKKALTASRSARPGDASAGR
jgi:glycosyltransferase involved in cell wall biosynthesis